MATCPRNMRPMQQAIGVLGLRKYQVANEVCVEVSGRRYACTSRGRTTLYRRATKSLDEVSLPLRFGSSFEQGDRLLHKISPWEAESLG